MRAWWRMTGATQLLRCWWPGQGSEQVAHIELSSAPASAQTGAEMQGQDTMGVSLSLLTLLAVYMLAPTR